MFVYFLLVLLILSVTVVKMLSVKMHVSILNFHVKEWLQDLNFTCEVSSPAAEQCWTSTCSDETGLHRLRAVASVSSDLQEGR